MWMFDRKRRKEGTFVLLSRNKDRILLRTKSVRSYDSDLLSTPYISNHEIPSERSRTRTHSHYTEFYQILTPLKSFY